MFKIVPVQPLRILIVSTKSPWPPVDGGRLLQLNTIRALAAEGHRVALVAPCTGERDEIAEALGETCTPHLVGAAPRSPVTAALLGLVRGIPATIARHSLPAVRRTVNALLDVGDIDVIVAEQVHALPQTAGANERGVPVVHRAHNVESMLWAFAASRRGPGAGSVLAREARRMSDWEVGALERCAATVTLVEPDRLALSELAPGAVIHTVRAPFAATLPAGPGPLQGEPVVVTLASATWAPSRDAVDGLVADVWPAVQRRLPGAALHIFGDARRDPTADRVVTHPPPSDSRTAFPEGAIVIIPERHPTGVPMKALEAWARGLPVLAGPRTAELLEARDGNELLVARGAADTAAAVVRLAEESDLRQRLVDGGRRALAERHDLSTTATHLARVLRWAVDHQP